jgi:hypothetical protein
VRATLNVGGFVIEKLDEQNTQVTYISDVDINGVLPEASKTVYFRNESHITENIQTAMQNDGIE